MGQYRHAATSTRICKKGRNAAKRRRTVHRSGNGVSAGVSSPQRIRVVLVAAERLFREALNLLLSREPSIELVGEASDGTQALAVIRDVEPDVVLFDPSLPGVDYTETIRSIRQGTPQARILLLSATRDGGEICRALRAGAQGHVSTNADLAAVTKAIHAVYRGDVWIEPKLIAEALWAEGAASVPGGRGDASSNGCLTAREQQIVRLLASGGTNRDIGEALGISEKTVKTHLNSVFRKLNVTGRLQAVLYAVRAGL
jgi:two-component system nitrate/nitrite response regulator NarL